MKRTNRFITVLIFIFLYIPMAVLVVASFNTGKNITHFDGFTFQQYVKLFKDDGLLELLRKQTPRRPQTVLLSATLSPQLEQLATLSLQEPSFLDVDKLRREKDGGDVEKGDVEKKNEAEKEGDATEKE